LLFRRNNFYIQAKGDGEMKCKYIRKNDKQCRQDIVLGDYCITHYKMVKGINGYKPIEERVKLKIGEIVMINLKLYRIDLVGAKDRQRVGLIRIRHI
jgi:hypothetical protein